MANNFMADELILTGADDLEFAPMTGENEVEQQLEDTWKVMLVDDNAEAHHVAKLSLQKFTFENKQLKFISAYSGEEAKHLIEQNPDTALILLDVVMEEDDSGLQVAEYVRKILGNRVVRIVLRTGQPGIAPEEKVFLDYDINDYKLKTELTWQKMYTTVVASLRSYRDILLVEEKRHEVEELNSNLAKQKEQLLQLNEQLQAEIVERKKLEAVYLEKERLRIEKELLEEQSQRLAKLNADKDRFFSIIAHDLKGPFLPVIGNAQLLTEMFDRFQPTQVRDMCEKIYHSAKRVVDLLDNLLEWARLESGRMDYQPQNLNLYTVVEANVDLLFENAAYKKITLHSTLQRIIMVQVDSYMVDTVVRNLISNAIKFTPEVGFITISAKITNEPSYLTAFNTSRILGSPLSNSFVEVEVADTGVGISPKDLKKLFAIETHHTTLGTAHEQGTGLGLIICAEMVVKNKGQIWVESEVGQGTKVKFTLPLAG